MIAPHGGELVDRFTDTLENYDHSIVATPNRQIDIYNIASGAYSPLIGFAKSDDFSSILKSMRLASGHLWSIPMVLDISDQDREQIGSADGVNISDEQGVHIATLSEIEIYPFAKDAYCQSVFGTTDDDHPGVKRTMSKYDSLIGGELRVKKDWVVDFEGVGRDDMLSPSQTRELFEKKNLSRIVAFQTRNVPHRGHEYIQKCALEMVDGLLVHPVIGEKKPGDFRDEIILGAYQVLLKKYYNPKRVTVSCLPWVMRYAGPKEAIMHALIRQNFGCTHFIIGRDHAGVGDYYGTYEAQEIFDTLQSDDLQIQIMRFENAAYCPEVHGVVTDKTAPSPQAQRICISGTKFRTMLQEGQDAPKEFIRPEIMDYLHSQDPLFVT